MPNQMTTVDTLSDDPQILSPRYTELAKQYKTFAKTAAENILKLAETLVRAKAELAPREFDHFCEEVSLKKDRATFRKLMKIGEKYARFEPVLNRLPNQWTTIYKLATISEEGFQRVLNSNQLSSFMTANQVGLILDDKPKSKKGAAVAVCTISLSGLENGQKLKAYQHLAVLKKQFNFDLE